MDQREFKRELSLLMAHYLRERFPQIYPKFAALVKEKDMLPAGVESVDDCLNTRYKAFPSDQFMQFLQRLRPDDDFPSIFRRLDPFPEPVRGNHFRMINPMKRVFCHLDTIYCLAVDPLYRILVTGADDFSIKVWTLPDLEPICRFAGHEDVITNLCINRTSTLLLSSSHDKTVRLWSLETGKEVAVLSEFTTKVVHYATFSPSGAMIAAACEDGSVPLWITSQVARDSKPCRVIFTPGKGATAWVAFSPGGEFLAYSCEPSLVMIVALKSMRQWQLELHTGLVSTVRFMTDYYTSGADVSVRLITAANEEGQVVIWQPEGTQWRPKFVFKHAGSGRRPAKMLTWSLDANEEILVICKTSGVYICDALTGETMGEMPKSAGFDNVSCVAGSPVASEVFFFGNKKGVVTIADVQERRILCEMKSADEDPYIDAVWSKDGEWVFACDKRGSITAFRCFGENDPEQGHFPPYTQIDVFEGKELGKIGERQWLDRSGNPTTYQPKRHDFRDLDLAINVLQQPMIRAGVTEMILISRMMTNEDGMQTETASGGLNAPPPLHIRQTVECPVNPHGATGVFSAGGEEEAIEVAEKFDITSDTEDWCMDQTDFDQNEDEWVDRIVHVSASDIPKGVWPVWATCIAYDSRVYLPQIGDDVAFVPSAYADFCRSQSLSIPSSLSDTTVLHCIISGMRSSDEYLLLSLSSPENTHIISDVKFKPATAPLFLMLWSYYKVAVKKAKELKVGDCVQYSIIRDGELLDRAAGDITELSDGDPYQSIKVSGSGDSVLISPWNIVNPKLGAANIDTQDTQLWSALVQLRALVFRIAADPSARPITTTPQDPKYQQEVEFPMSLTIVKERIDARYYRSVQAVIFDLEQFSKNEAVFHPRPEDRVKEVKDLADMMLKSFQT